MSKTTHIPISKPWHNWHIYSRWSAWSVWTALLDIIFPTQCIGCETYDDYLCKTCKKQLLPHPEQCLLCHTRSPAYQLCPTCTKESPLEGIVVWFQYTGLMKQLILSLKFYQRSHIAAFLAQRISNLLMTHPYIAPHIAAQTVVTTYVPSHWIRKHFVKWYNQSELLASHIATQLGIPFKHLTTRTRYTRSQTSLNRKQRLSNLIWVFWTSHTDTLNWDETILIIDDITTTGSTLTHVAKQIKSIYPDVQIWWVVVGRHWV